MADARLRGRDNLYKLIISQLRYDGYEAIAATLSKIVNTNAPCPPSATLFHVVNVGLQAEGEGARPELTELPGLASSTSDDRGIDMEYEPEGIRADGPSQTSSCTSADEGFMSELKLQKVGLDANKSPSLEDIHKHILKISSQDTLACAPREIKVLIPSVETNSDHPESETDICVRVKNELQRFGVSQEVFAKAVVGKTQGYLSEMLKLGEKLFAPFDGSYSKGLNNFEIMRKFLARPEEERRLVYKQKADELKAERQRKRMGIWNASTTNQKRQFIPCEAKEVMDECFVGDSQYVTPSKRQELADHLNIPEQCVSDYFKNLKSRNKHSERNATQVKEETIEDGRCVCEGVSELPVASLVQPSCDSAPLVKGAHSQSLCDSVFSNTMPVHHITPPRQRLPNTRSPDQDTVASKIAALGKNISKQNKENNSGHKAPRPNVETQTSTAVASSSIDVKCLTHMDLSALQDTSFILQESTRQHFEVGQEIFVMPLENNTTTVHISPNF